MRFLAAAADEAINPQDVVATFPPHPPMTTAREVPFYMTSAAGMLVLLALAAIVLGVVLWRGRARRRVHCDVCDNPVSGSYCGRCGASVLRVVSTSPPRA